MWSAGSQQLASVALSKLNFESFARELLLVRQHRVEVYTSSSKRGKGQWTLSFKARPGSLVPPGSYQTPQASPGNLQQLEEVLFGGGAIPHTALTTAVRLGRSGGGGRLVGVAFADTTDNILGVAEFTDNDQLSELQVSV